MEPLTQFDALVPAFQKVAAGTTASDLDATTPCAEWKVRDLFAHLIGGATTFAAVVRGETPPEAPPDVDDAMVPATASSAIADLDSAFRLPGALERTYTTPFGDLTGDVFARLLAFDMLMHTWDLARATGQTVTVPDDVLAAVDGFARQALTPELRRPGVFAAEVEPADGASPLDRLAAFAGRRA